MGLFTSTLSQMAFLLLLIFIGFFLAKRRIIPAEGANLLSKLENNVFIPALALGTFSQNFSADQIGYAGQYFLCGLLVISIAAPLAVLISRSLTKDRYLRNIYTYGLAFANFGFMGNAVVAALFPDIFMEYMVFSLPLWIFIYVWGAPYLLMPPKGGRSSFLSGLSNLLNPMFIGMILGAVLGLTGLPIPSFLSSAFTTLGNCMSPMAMLLTGITIASIDLRAAVKNRMVYILSIIRLVIIPLIAIGLLSLIPISYGLALCTVCTLAMPLGLNSVVIPSAYGLDTSAAAGMALVSHVLSCISIPVIFMLFDMLMKAV